MTIKTKISRASVKEVEKRVDAQYLAIKAAMAELCDAFQEHSFDDMLHALTHGYTWEYWYGPFDVSDAILFIEELRLLVRVGRSPAANQEQLEERIQELFSIDTAQRLEDLLYYTVEASCNVSDKWDDHTFRVDMLFLARLIRDLLRECAKLTGHDKE